MALAEDEKSVDITVSILSKYKIRKDAQFHIDALGFLGDQYVSITPPEPNSPAPPNENGFFKDGDTVTGEPTFNMIEAVQSISGVVNQAKRVMIDLDKAITNVNATVLSQDTLGHLVVTVSNLQAVSERAVGAARRAEALLNDNAGPFDSAVHNFQTVSIRLTNAATELDGIVVTNRDDIREAIVNLTAASAQIKGIAQDLEAGKGPAGSLLKDEQMRAQLESVVSNADSITAEFSTFGSNLNQKGIWAMLWRPKHPETNSGPGHR
jgi:phospholipid/cholesterol/gamma-HCH transport system substrate-binding protein